MSVGIRCVGAGCNLKHSGKDGSLRTRSKNHSPGGMCYDVWSHRGETVKRTWDYHGHVCLITSGRLNTWSIGAILVMWHVCMYLYFTVSEVVLLVATNMMWLVLWWRMMRMWIPGSLCLYVHPSAFLSLNFYFLSISSGNLHEVFDFVFQDIVGYLQYSLCIMQRQTVRRHRTRYPLFTASPTQHAEVCLWFRHVHAAWRNDTLGVTSVLEAYLKGRGTHTLNKPTMCPIHKYNWFARIHGFSVLLSSETVILTMLPPCGSHSFPPFFSPHGVYTELSSKANCAVETRLHW